MSVLVWPVALFLSFLSVSDCVCEAARSLAGVALGKRRTHVTVVPSLRPPASGLVRFIALGIGSH